VSPGPDLLPDVRTRPRPTPIDFVQRPDETFTEGTPRKKGRDILLDGLPPAEAQAARTILDECQTLELEPGALDLPRSVNGDPLLVVDAGLFVLRSVHPHVSRSVLTLLAAPGGLLVPPAEHETLQSLVGSRLVVVSELQLRRLLGVPGVARVLVEALSAALRQTQETIGNFASTRHLDRVRERLLQLARAYGKVGPDGVRIDFPISHMLLAEMIGSSRETVTRAVDELQRVGFLTRRGRCYRLLVSAETEL
jgi:CRP-like cAMP-binding protein